MTALVVYWVWCMGAFAVGAVVAAVAVTLLVPARSARQAVDLLTEDARAALGAPQGVPESEVAEAVGRQAELAELALDGALVDDASLHTDARSGLRVRQALVRRSPDVADVGSDRPTDPREGRP